MRWWRRSPKPRKTYPVPSDLLAWAQAVDVSRLSEDTVKAADDYLQEYGSWKLFVRGEAGRRLVSVIDTQVSPPPPLDGMPSDILAIVLAVRRKQLGTSEWPGWATWPGVSDWPDWAEWPGWDRTGR
jgi:hypothetical protein